LSIPDPQPARPGSRPGTTAGAFGALQVLQRAHHVEQPHRHGHPQKGHQLNAPLPEGLELHLRNVQTDLGHSGVPAGRIDHPLPRAPGQQHRQRGLAAELVMVKGCNPLML
jgi:hypothetical protein